MTGKVQIVHTQFIQAFISEVNGLLERLKEIVPHKGADISAGLSYIRNWVTNRTERLEFMDLFKEHLGPYHDEILARNFDHFLSDDFLDAEHRDMFGDSEFNVMYEIQGLWRSETVTDAQRNDAWDRLIKIVKLLDKETQLRLML